MSSLAAPLVALGTAATTNVAVFIPALIAAIAYFQYEIMDPESRPINTETDSLMNVYDFIVIGSGSAGK